MKNKFICIIFVIAVSFVLGINAVNAELFLSGDTNITNPLTGSSGAAIDTGNQKFFANILQGGNSVAVLKSTWTGSVGSAYTDVNTFYNSLPGVTSTVISGTINSLAGYDLLVAPLPNNAFAASEITVFSNFLAQGGSIFFTGENNDISFAMSNSAINAALAALGSGMSINPSIFDSGFNTAIGAQIAADPFTAGVGTFTYAAPSEVLYGSGTPLFFGKGGQAFLSYEQTSNVPLPAAFWIFGSGLLGLLGIRRRIQQ